MDIIAIAAKAFPPALLVVMVTIGLATRPRDALYLLERPALLGRSFAAIFFVVPAAVMLLTYFAPIAEPAEAALIALSVSPMLPVLPAQLTKAGVENRLAVSLEVTCVAMALVVAPFVFWLVSRITGYALDISTASLLTAMAVGVLLPLAVGMLINGLFPDFALRIAEPLFKIAMAVLVIAMLATLWSTRAYIAEQFTWPVIAGAVVLIVTGLVAGHLIGAPDRSIRIALAQTAASRHPGFAIAVGAAVAPKAVATVVGVVIIYFILRAVLAGAYSSYAGRADGERAADA